MKKKKKKSGGKVIRQLVPKAALALKNEFYLETAMILSALFESRLKNLIIRVERINPGFGFGLDKCIKRVKYLVAKNPESLIARHFDIQMIISIRKWKNQRNDILRDLATIHVSGNRMKKLAQEGIALFQEFNTANKQFKKEWKKELIKPDKSSAIPDEPKKEN